MGVLGGILKAAFNIGATAVLVVALIIAVPKLLPDLNPFDRETIDRSGPTMLERIRNLEEFTAAEASFTQDVDIEEDSFLPSVLAGQSVVAIVTGSVRATVDLGGLDESSVEVDEETDTIRIELPDPTLDDADIDEKSARIIDRDRGLVDRVEDVFSENPTDDGPIFAKAEERLNAAAAESDLVERARLNTEVWMTTFLGAAGFDTIVVTWP